MPKSKTEKILHRVKLPNVLQFLFLPSRFKVAYGGRGSAKSWGIARALLMMGVTKKLRILCAREIQSSIEESVHALLKSQIGLLGLGKFYHINNRSIVGINGTEFLFEGLLRNVDKIKSMEGIDICWVEEAHNVTEEAWEIVTPTIRKDADPNDNYKETVIESEEEPLTLNLNEGAEIWVSFNPKYEDDPTYQKFVANPPENCASVSVNYLDNPWFPEVLRIEMEQDKARDEVLYEQKWLGKPVGTGGRVFPAFDKDLHVRTFDRKLIAEKGNCFMAMDPHSHYYPFCTWLAIIPKNDRMNWPEDFHKHIYAEWPTFEDLRGFYHDLRKKLFYKGSLKDLAKEIYAKDGVEWGIKVRERFIDTRYAKGSGSWNWSTSTEGIVELFAKVENGGLEFSLPYEKAMDAQRQVLHKDMLYNKLIPINSFNEPSFSVDPSCRNTIIALKNHRLEENSEKESEKYKEPSDTIRINYAGIKDFEYEDPTPEEENSIMMGGGHQDSTSWMG